MNWRDEWSGQDNREAPTNGQLPHLPRADLSTGRQSMLNLRLGILREQIARGANNALWGTSISVFLTGVLVLVALGVLSFLLVDAMSDPLMASNSTWLRIMDLCFESIMLALILAGLYFSLRYIGEAKRVFDRFPLELAAARKQFEETDLALIFAWEDLHHMLHQRLEAARLIKRIGRFPMQSFELHLEHCACHHQSLQKLLRQAEHRLEPTFLISDEQLFDLRKLYQFAGLLPVACLLAGFVTYGAAWILLAFFYAFSGPRYVKACTVLLAFIDFCLDVPTQQPAPPPGGFQH